MTVTSYAVAMGSNRPHGRHGDPRRVLAAAATALAHAGPAIRARAPIIESDAIGPAGRRFANTTLLIETSLSPRELLCLLQMTERDFGRRPGRRWGPRVLDLDIVLWSGGCWRSPGLTIPHRSLADRAFVLRPLAKVVPGWRVPPHGRTVRQLLARLRRRPPASGRGELQRR